MLPLLKKIAATGFDAFNKARLSRIIYIRYFCVSKTNPSGTLAGTHIGSQPVVADCNLGGHSADPNRANDNVANILVSAKT